MEWTVILLMYCTISLFAAELLLMNVDSFVHWVIGTFVFWSGQLCLAAYKYHAQIYYIYWFDKFNQGSGLMVRGAGCGFWQK